jgi:peptide chain release factor subunit 1
MSRTAEQIAQLDRLTTVDTGPYPVVSLYLNLQADDRGRDRFDTFIKNAWPARLDTYPAGPERQSLDRDGERIRAYLAGIEPSVEGLALFACAGADLFEAVPLAAPVGEHRLFISSDPHLYPLARLIDEYPRYAVLVADTHSARLFVVAANAIERTAQVESPKTKRHKVGGWSQARFQRHVDHFREQHAKEVVDVLTRIVRDEQIPSIVIAGDEVIVPLLKGQLPRDLHERLVDVVRLDIRAPEHVILQRSLEVIQQQDVQSDRERIEALFDAFRSGGLGVVGMEATQRALERGQVEELVLTAVPQTLDTGERSAATSSEAERSGQERVADDLIVKARQTAASIRFIQDPELLKPVGGVGAFLRFTL